MPLFSVNDGTGAQIHYEIIEGVLPQDTLFIHGNMASNRWWYPAAEVWKKKGLGQKGAMILAEFRGCGGSTPPKSQAEVGMHVLAQDFIGLVDSLKRGPLHLVGHSTGGLIAALMLAKRPELFARAVLLDPVGAKGVTFDESMTAAFEQMKKDRDLVALVMGSTIKDNDADSEFFRQCIVEDGFHAIQTVGDKVLRALSGLDICREVQLIPNAVLVLHGEKDTLLPRKDSEELARLISKAEFQEIENQGHCTNVENPSKFVELTGSFLFR